jgi:hypothetical protein
MFTYLIDKHDIFEAALLEYRILKWFPKKSVFYSLRGKYDKNKNMNIQLIIALNNKIIEGTQNVGSQTSNQIRQFRKWNAT